MVASPQTMTNPVSVCLPVYNGMPFLPAAVDSILENGYSEIQLVISLDNSTDSSGGYVESLRDSRITVVHNQTGGLFNNLNNAIRSATHDLIQVFCQDDVMMPGYLQSQASHFQEDPDLGVVLANCGKIFGDSGEVAVGDEPGEAGVLDRSVWLWKQANHGSVADSISCVMLNRAVLRDDCLFDDSYAVAGDVEFYNRIALRYRMAYNGTRLFLNRSHPQQESRKWTSVLPYAKEERRIVAEHWARLLPGDVLKAVLRYRAEQRGALHVRSSVKMIASGHLSTAVQVISEVLSTYGFKNLALGSFAPRKYKPPSTSPHDFEVAGSKM